MGSRYTSLDMRMPRTGDSLPSSGGLGYFTVGESASIGAGQLVMGDHSSLDTLALCWNADLFVLSNISFGPLSHLQLRS